MKCPQCKEDISEYDGFCDSDVNGFLDFYYECENCEITIYKFKMEKGVSQ